METVPSLIPVATPVGLTVAVEFAELLHTPPAVALVKLIMPPTQTDLAPEIGPGNGGCGFIMTVTSNLTALSHSLTVWPA